VSTKDFAVTHQFDRCWVAFADSSQVILLEITIDPEGVGISVITSL